MILVFKLSMPGVNSWNGHWSGQDKLYAKVISFGRTKKAKDFGQKILEIRHFTYNFGDGWCAAVTVEEVDKNEAARIRRKSAGFCGYEWMIDSIKNNLEIKI